MASANDVGAILGEVAAARISPAAAVFAAHRALPPGHVIALMYMGTVELCLASPGTQANRPQQGTRLNESLVSKFSAESGEATLSGRLIRWWRFDQETKFTKPTDGRSASEILREVIEDVYGAAPSRERTHAFSSINGIAGYAKGAYSEVASEEEMYARLRARFVDRPEHVALVNHSKFDDYLVRKAQELAAR